MVGKSELIYSDCDVDGMCVSGVNRKMEDGRNGREYIACRVPQQTLSNASCGRDHACFGGLHGSCCA
jgi:hypothetical protein